MKQIDHYSEAISIDTRMSVIKPLVLKWCFESWRSLENRPELIIKGWYKCMITILDPFNQEVQSKATEKSLRNQLEAYDFVFGDAAEPEPDRAYWEIQSDSECDDELDVMKKRVEGSRKRNRDRKQTRPAFGDHLTIATDQIEISDEEASEFE
jgi:hypothetical protein